MYERSWPRYLGRNPELSIEVQTASSKIRRNMNRTLAEILLFVSVATNAALLIFIAGVLRKVINDIDEPAFKHFLGSLYRHSARSPFMHTVLTIPFLGTISYFYFYGFRNRWITAGLALWLVAGCISKMTKVPIYKRVVALKSGDVAGLSRAPQTKRWETCFRQHSTL
jgi:hypothetical protein